MTMTMNDKVLLPGQLLGHLLCGTAVVIRSVYGGKSYRITKFKMNSQQLDIWIYKKIQNIEKWSKYTKPLSI